MINPRREIDCSLGYVDKTKSPQKSEEIYEELAQKLGYENYLERRFFIYGCIDYTDTVYVERIQNDFANLQVPDITRYILAINREDNKAEKLAKENGIDFFRKPIWIYIDSTGGCEDEGMALINAMVLSATPVYTVNLSLWYSMGFLIGICGHKRYSMPYAKFMFHDGFNGTMGSASRAEEKMAFDKKYEREVVKKIMLGHSDPKKFNSRTYDKLYPHDNFMMAEKALEYGFIDEIVTDLSVLG